MDVLCLPSYENMDWSAQSSDLRDMASKNAELSTVLNELSLQGLTYGDSKLFSCGADGSIRSWTVGKKGELEPLASRDKAHKDRVSNIVYKKVFLLESLLAFSLTEESCLQ